MKKKCVIGLGSPLYHDDGIGIYLLENLQESSEDLLSSYDFIDGGTGGFNLIHIINSYDILFIIDAVRFNQPPGTLKFFTPKDVKSLSYNEKLSTHSQDFLQILDITKKIIQNMPHIIIAGIQPADMSFGKGLSHELKQNLDKITNEIILNLNELQINNP